jgi:pimeloyl-ACP methyl ester carboxylesterase
MKKTLATIILFLIAPLFFSFSQTAVAQNATLSFKVKPLSQKTIDGPISIAKQGSFFIGGKEIESNTLSTLPAYAPSGTITVDQMYVRYQFPVKAKSNSLVFIHGCCLTGKSWETTPDGRMGWDEYFVKRGFPTYVIDQSGRGRSAVNATAMNATKMGKEPLEKLPVVFAASHESAWTIFRFGVEYPQVHQGMKFPIASQNGLWQQMVPDWVNAMPTPNPTVSALSELSKDLKKTVLISHSQSGIYPFQTAALSTDGISGIISIEPASCPAADSDLSPYTKMPVMVLFGDYVELSPRWAPRLKACREFVQKTNQAGGRAELLVLPEIGIKGNSHMLMQDSNNIQIADILGSWIEDRIKN